MLCVCRVSGSRRAQDHTAAARERPVKATAAAEMDALRAAPKGERFDRTYIDREVGVHQAVIELARKAHSSADNAQLKALIEKAQPILERHLERAEEIQKRLGKPTA